MALIGLGSVCPLLAVVLLMLTLVRASSADCPL